MSINWSWDDKIGIWKSNLYGKEYTFNVYKCNGLAVILHEYKDEETNEDMYNLQIFFCDKDHLRNLLGTKPSSKEFKENCFNNKLLKVELINCKESRIIISELIKAKWDNEIEIKLIPEIPF